MRVVRHLLSLALHPLAAAALVVAAALAEEALVLTEVVKEDAVAE